MGNDFLVMPNPLETMSLPCPEDICDGSGIIPDDGTEGSVEQKCLCRITYE